MILGDAMETRTLSEFQKNTDAHIRRVWQTKAPLSVRVEAEQRVVVQDAETYQHMVDRLDEMELVEAVNAAEAQFHRGGGPPAREALMELTQKLGTPG
jgi:PHD/YefM family antitoxin component YafN of YafNO toxin-antitoxin module